MITITLGFLNMYRGFTSTANGTKFHGTGRSAMNLILQLLREEAPHQVEFKIMSAQNNRKRHYDILLCGVGQNGPRAMANYSASVKVLWLCEQPTRYGITDRDIQRYSDFCFGYINRWHSAPPKLVRWPNWMYYWDFYSKGSTAINDLFECNTTPLFKQRKRKVCFIARNPDRGRRIKMVQQLRNTGLAVDCPGIVCKNMPDVSKLTGLAGKRESKERFMQDYLFNLCPENGLAAGYVTEKIMQACVCGTIPIYFGADDEHLEPKIINPARVIRTSEISTKLFQLLNDDDRLQKFFEQPVFLPTAKETIEEMLTQIRQLAKNIVTKALAAQKI